MFFAEIWNLFSSLGVFTEIRERAVYFLVLFERPCFQEQLDIFTKI